MAKRSVFNCLTELRSYLSSIELLDTKKNVFILFTGNKDLNDKSWCSDCNIADPVIHANLEILSKNSEFITCYVGDRPM